MKLRWAALLYVLALGALVPTAGAAQDSSAAKKPPPERSPGFELGQNYPNPFNPATTIPFTLGDPPACSEQGRSYRVTLRIYNVLAQLVAIPVLLGGDGATGQPVVNLQLHCGSYAAFWDGNYLNSSQEISSGVYLYRIEVEGRAVAKKMIVIK